MYANDVHIWCDLAARIGQVCSSHNRPWEVFSILLALFLALCEMVGLRYSQLPELWMSWYVKRWTPFPPPTWNKKNTHLPTAYFYVWFLINIIRHEQLLLHSFALLIFLRLISPNILLCTSTTSIHTLYLTRQGPPQPRFGVGRRWTPEKFCGYLGKWIIPRPCYFSWKIHRDYRMRFSAEIAAR